LQHIKASFKLFDSFEDHLGRFGETFYMLNISHDEGVILDVALKRPFSMLIWSFKDSFASFGIFYSYVFF
jgi:hypothetical protein